MDKEICAASRKHGKINHQLGGMHDEPQQEKIYGRGDSAAGQQSVHLSHKEADRPGSGVRGGDARSEACGRLAGSHREGVTVAPAALSGSLSCQIQIYHI